MLSVSRDFHDRMRTSEREIEIWLESAEIDESTEAEDDSEINEDR